MTDETLYPFTTYFTVRVSPFKRVSLFDRRTFETAELVRDRLLGIERDCYTEYAIKNQEEQVRANADAHGPFVYRSHKYPEPEELLAYAKLKVEGLIK